MNKSIPAGEFKAKCLALLDFVNENKATFTITKRGKVVAQLVPVTNNARTKKVFGCMQENTLFNCKEEELINFSAKLKWSGDEENIDRHAHLAKSRRRTRK